MFSSQALSESAFSEQAYAPIDSLAFQAFLAEITSPRCWLLEIDAFAINAAAVTYGSAAFSDGAFSEYGFGDGMLQFPSGWQTDFEGNQHRLLVGEVRVQVARRVQNLLPSSDFTSGTYPSGWGTTTATVTTGITDPFGGTRAVTLTATAGNGNVSTAPLNSYSAGMNVVWIKRRIGTGTINLYRPSASADDVTAQVTTSWKRFASTVSATNGGRGYFIVELATSGDAVDLAYPMQVDVTGATNQNPPEDVSVGFESAPYHGAGVDSVKYFDTLNGNTVSSNVITEATGAAIDFPDVQVSGINTLRFSTHGFTTAAADTPARTWYDGRLNDGVTVDRRIVGKDGLGGLATVFAEASLVNLDGALDLLLSNYAIDGRAARIYIGPADGALSDFGLLFSGVVESALIGTDAVQFRFSDGSARLENAIINETSYAGTGGLEGGADLAGKAKPKGWGHVFNIAPPLVDSANLIYQVNDGAISDVPEAYDRQVVLTKVAGAPAGGEYQIDASAGTFTLGATPAGTVTCNAKLDASGTGYIDTAADIVRRILVDSVGLYSSEIEPMSFDRLKTDVPAEVGIPAMDGSTSASQIVDQLLAGVGAFGGFNRQGAFSVGLIAEAAGVPVLTLTSENIIDITRESLPAAVAPIIWHATVAYQRNHMVQTDVAASVTAARRTFAAEAVRVSTSEDLAIKSRHLLACAYTNDTGLYADSADADAEALRLFNLWGTERGMYRVKARPEALICDLGTVVEVRHPRHGFANGRSARVLAHTIRGSEVEMLVLC
jgi:hypothetical protein